MIAPLLTHEPSAHTGPAAEPQQEIPPPPPPTEFPAPQQATPETGLRTNFLTDFRRKPFPVFPPDKPSTDRLAEYTDAELSDAADAGLEYPIGPPQPRPAWTQSLLDEDDDDEQPEPLPRAVSH
jgi:hypothetical protein